jgi:branched-chain amino acid transport system substrate-binding protein
MKTSMMLRRSKIAAIAAAAALVMTACGTSDGDSEEAPADSSLLGTPNKASGDPVLLGYIGEGKGQAIDTSEEGDAIKAAVKYINAYKGGINGRPIELKSCATEANAAKAKDCANQMVQAKVLAVLEGTSGEIDQAIDVLAPAGIPLVAHGAATQKASTTPGVFGMINALAYFGVPATVARDEGIKKAVQVVTAVPAAEGPAKMIGGITFGNAGVEMDVVSIAPGTADATPQITAAAKGNPGLYHVTGDPAHCTSVIKAIKTVDPDAKITMIDRCIGDDTAKSLPGGYEGIGVVTGANLTDAGKDYPLFKAVLAKYAGETPTSSAAASGYAPMIALAEALTAAELKDYSSKGIVAALKAAPAADYPLTDGIQFQCNGKAVALSPNTCSADGLLAQADKDGKLSDFKVYPAGDVYAPPAA